MNVTVISELYEKMWIEKTGFYDVILLTKHRDNEIIELAEIYVQLYIEKDDDDYIR
jgi:hypothetical protein